MTELLQKAFNKLAQLPEPQQNQIASTLLREMEIHPEFGVLVSVGEEIYEEFGITPEEIEADRKALGLS